MFKRLKEGYNNSNNASIHGYFANPGFYGRQISLRAVIGNLLPGPYPFSDCFAYTIRESSVLEKIRTIDSLPVGHTAIVFNEFDQRIYAASRSSQEIFRIEANSNAGEIGSLIGNSNDDSAIAASFETGDLFTTYTSAGRVMRYDQNLNWNQILVNSDLTSYEDD
jgi:hypothetical protein